VKGSQIPRAILSSIFLKQAPRWGDGQPVQPVDQSLRSKIRQSFVADVLQQPMVEVQIFWSRKMATGVTPPPVQADGPGRPGLRGRDAWRDRVRLEQHPAAGGSARDRHRPVIQFSSKQAFETIFTKAVLLDHLGQTFHRTSESRSAHLGKTFFKKSEGPVAAFAAPGPSLFFGLLAKAERAYAAGRPSTRGSS
jgi:hypothetical protein